MKLNRISKSTLYGLLLSSFLATAQKTNLEVDLTKSITKIQPTMYGVFFEDINFAADGGLYAEMVKNRSFEFNAPLMGWSQPNSSTHSMNKESGLALPMRTEGNPKNADFCRVTINNDKAYQIINEGFRGMGIKKDAKYNLSLKAANHDNAIKKIIIQFIDANKNVLGETTIVPSSSDWKDYSAQIIATGTEAKAQLKISFEGTGIIDLDMISLFPQETWKNRKNGLRKDIVQLLYDLKPGFIRFPGGCIVEGMTLDNRYQWKKTVGPVEDRETMINRWNVEFKNKQAPDYFQSFGLGFFEYFQLSEDIGAQPLPILSCGIACQYNSGELVPMEELDPYVQDALDLIEFANGAVTTKWGKLRADMGHPNPFNLKFIGVGNEQWGPQYIERYKVFAKAIKEKYPNITIVSGAGPSPDGTFFDYGWDELKKMNAEIIDEHYYKNPEWFKENAKRYDNYDRKGPKVFAGEYAAHPKGVEDGLKENNWLSALSESAFMTGLERNADVVYLTSYAPLMAHVEAYQWAPDMIWFDNLNAYGTANYYVQKLYSNNKGTDVLSITEDGKALTGQNDLYATAAKDANQKELIVKLVNTSAKVQDLSINLSGNGVESKGKMIVLTHEKLDDYNTLAEPTKILPVEKEYKTAGKKAAVSLPAYSFVVLKLKLK
ncbi:alpha-N-arabinofuranosidase [Flavobacterium glycines]|uniref:non-reducing end alpha-L-arabinofuranosidase n=1 Tax=Flavobacterium glycines TaxID=551990 RepID=A0A1B9DYH9_9FLAO|nr:alpha-L-arabinofuranosidase C-terminal domain-containing protein [Flavobacterium glycines]OCB74752.1 alpha-L-arabinofuranosidase [Flavobacterium glycines]GEL09266.1 alpha-L-arabinofuranosidase [Flavobacterium glycines]SDJ13050.1 alpha-N-arabinofuranosidase [Flavobacterium glycines]